MSEVRVKLPRELLRQLDTQAQAAGTSREEALLALLEVGLGKKNPGRVRKEVDVGG